MTTANRPITGKIKVFDESGNIIYENCDSNALPPSQGRKPVWRVKKNIPRKGG